MPKESDMETFLFKGETTYLNDYHKYELKAPIKTIYKERKGEGKKRKQAIPPAVPFYLFHKPKPIIRTHPKDKQERFEKNKDPDREEVQKTRPRLVMTPAVGMDDIVDNKAREILCRDTYTSCTRKAQEEAAPNYRKIEAPFAEFPAPANPIFLRKLEPPYVSPEWRMETVSWDNNQLRAHCDPTKEFWLSYPLFSCRSCDESATVKKHRKMQLQMKGKH